MSEAPRYNFRKPNRRRWLKLRREDVTEIRRWVRTEGYGLRIYEQVDCLRETRYPDMSIDALYEVITNQSWFDATYDRTVPVFSQELPTIWASLLSISPYWAMILILLWTLKRGHSC